MSTFTERRQRVTDTSGILMFLELTAASFTGPMQIVADDRDWVSQGVTYIGIQFGFKGPDDVSGQTPRAQLEMVNVGTGIVDELERLQPNETVMAKLMIADRADPDTHARTLYLPLTRVSVNGTTATAQCGRDFMMRQQAVLIRGNPFTLPGNF